MLLLKLSRGQLLQSVLGGWTIRVRIEYENGLRKVNEKNGYIYTSPFSITEQMKEISIFVSENSAYITNYKEEPLIAPRLPGFVDPTLDNSLDRTSSDGPIEVFIEPLSSPPNVNL